MGNKQYKVEILCENIMDWLLKEALFPVLLSVLQQYLANYMSLKTLANISLNNNEKNLWLNLFGNCGVDISWDLEVSIDNILYLPQVQKNSERDMKFWQIGEIDIEGKEV